MEEEEITQSTIVPCDEANTKDWYAWINKMPPPPDDFHVVGEILVSNPGINPILIPKEPQGINPNILLLDMFLHQKPGIWPRVMVWKPVKYDKVANINYSNVNVFCNNNVIADIEVVDAQ
ncbi:hypothetical protein [Flagellimonas marinaquae]|uniref:hypothetical protein n=1 Tax=Flagellimonas marinaquae TaxID=254955 RepID=UPI00207546C6|nr:hypothetical protein [Allomuricauda aquimarina]USD25085.1 hypothetical protein MJO53_15515 [Allomuricauda aquimarina]